MKRKDYRKPTMQVVQLQQTGMLMTSGLEAGRRSYGEANVQDWGGSGAGVKASRNYINWDNE